MLNLVLQTYFEYTHIHTRIYTYIYSFRKVSGQLNNF